MTRSPAEPTASAAAASPGPADSPDSPAAGDEAVVSPAPRRRGPLDSKTRAAMIEATAQLILDEGHAAVTARRVAAETGVNPGLVHYYFHSMDELFLAVFRHGAEANLRRQARALSSREPLRSLWKVNTDPRNVKLYMEFMVLSTTNADIRTELARYMELFREAEKRAFARAFSQRSPDTAAIPPAAASILLDGVARVIAIERGLGVSSGHDEMIALVDDYLGRFDVGDRNL
jgi:AcrR family transcriptional regulator